MRRSGTAGAGLLFDGSCIMTEQGSRIRKRVAWYCRVFGRGTTIAALRL
jgi:hypothetical protein